MPAPGDMGLPFTLMLLLSQVTTMAVPVHLQGSGGGEAEEALAPTAGYARWSGKMGKAHLELGLHDATEVGCMTGDLFTPPKQIGSSFLLLLLLAMCLSQDGQRKICCREHRPFMCCAPHAWSRLLLVRVESHVRLCESYATPQNQRDPHFLPHIHAASRETASYDTQDQLFHAST